MDKNGITLVEDVAAPKFSRQKVEDILSEAKIALQNKYTNGPFTGYLSAGKAVFIGDVEGGNLALIDYVFKMHSDAGLIVFLGDYVDRGDNGMAAVRLWKRFARSYFLLCWLRSSVMLSMRSFSS